MQRAQKRTPKDVSLGSILSLTRLIRVWAGQLATDRFYRRVEVKFANYVKQMFRSGRMVES